MDDPKDLWREQPKEGETMDARLLQRLMDQRAGSLAWKTRMDMIASIAAVVVFFLLLQWRLAWSQQAIPLIGMGAAAMWLIFAVARLRSRVSTPDMAAAGVDHYRRELERRRRHLRSQWIWQGPVVLAGLAMVATMLGQRMWEWEMASRAFPFLGLLGVWVAIGFAMRRAEVRRIEAELAELGRGKE